MGEAPMVRLRVRDIPVPPSRLEWFARDKNVPHDSTELAEVSPFEADKNVCSTIAKSLSPPLSATPAIESLLSLLTLAMTFV
jgi:hypothetical protein